MVARLRSMTRLIGFVVLVLNAGIAGAEPPAHVGSDACAECHLEVTKAWRGSDHANAWTLPDDRTVLGDFDDAVFEHGGLLTRFLRDGPRFLIETEGLDGQRRAYDVVGVAGIDPLQQYLLSPEPGRTQVYDIAWDVERRRWYPVFGDQVAPPGDGFHWTGPYKSWEARCAECHATGYKRNYSLPTNSYAPTMAEIGVGCEACHGPGSAHVAQARRGGTGETMPGLTAKGLTIDLGLSQQSEVMQCLTCHSRREAMQDGNPLPGTDYHDAFSISLLREGVYHPDGSILDEVFEGGSFLQSKMHAQGVRCSTCHEPHSAALRADGNAVCTQCHSPAGNSEFPSLTLKVYDGPEHHFHAGDGAGAQCVSCHMIERTYMGIDARRDHSFRVPRPDLAPTGSPNACTDCHDGQSAEWAIEELARRFPTSSHRGPHHATTFAAARLAPEGQAAALLDIAEGTETSGIVRATALELIGVVADRSAAERVVRLLSDADPLVRAAAAGTLRPLPADERLTRLRPLLSDPLRTVREAAARALLDVGTQSGSTPDAALSAALAEWQDALALRADFPETHLQIGGAALTMRNFGRALDAFRQAVAFDPQLVDAWTMIVRLQAALGDAEGSRRSLEEALAANPGAPALLALQRM
ncbi:multiheme c-type cytochrome [Aquibium carbonis]|nr:multiheme c-type cytochrome [Aquibium carbonis]